MSLPWRKWWRDILDHPVFINDPKAWRVFETLILLADDDGQWSGGIHQLADRIREKKSTVQGCLSRLEAQSMIVRSPNARYTVFSICNWGTYQSDARPTTVRTPYARRHSNKIKSKEEEKKNTEKPLSFLDNISTYQAMKKGYAL